MKQQCGFTLIELSIVLIIIGLLSAAVTSGFSILRDSNLKRIMADVEHYKGAIALFKNRYNAIPGDFARAGTIWGNDCNGSSTGSDECSGNGNRFIEHGSQDSLTNTSETLRLWQHLNNADMANLSLTGMPYSGCSANDICAQAGTNIPEAPLTNSGYYFYTDSSTRNTALIVGGNAVDSWNSAPIISPLEAYEIDNKIDDGVNSTGFFSGTGMLSGSSSWALTFDNAASNCSAGTSSGYNTATDDRTCGAAFIIGNSL